MSNSSPTLSSDEAELIRQIEQGLGEAQWT